MSTIRLEPGDMREVLARLIAEGVTVDSVVTDAPYHLTSIVRRFGAENAAPAKAGKTGAYARASAGFMGKKWDGGDIAFQAETWRLCYDLLKPGGHLLAFGGTRTYHRMACAIEDAGFEIRDLVADFITRDTAMQAFMVSLTEEQLAAFAKCLEDSQFGGMLGWVYGSGFPKSHNVAKAIDKAAGRELEIVPKGAPVKRMIPGADQNKAGWEKNDGREYQPGEYVPSEEAAPWNGWGTALKPALEPICLARKPLLGTVAANVLEHGTGGLNIDGCRIEGEAKLFHNGTARSGGIMGADVGGRGRETGDARGRWPANVVHDGSDEVVAAFPAAPGQLARSSSSSSRKDQNVYGALTRGSGGIEPRGDEGSAARFFYSAKADAGDRLESKHPTVKPVDLIRWLTRLITPPGGTVLDPFAGSGTTGMAAMAEGFHAILVEREAEYVADIRRRIAHVHGDDTPLFASKSAE